MSGTVGNSMPLSQDKVHEIEALRETMPYVDWVRLFRKAVGRLCEPAEMTVKEYFALKRQLKKSQR